MLNYIMYNDVVDLFSKIVQIDSPSGEEQIMGQYLETWLTEIGYKYKKDKLGSILTTNSKNPELLLCAHMDTVEPGRGIKPLIKDGFIQSDGKTILGADNKAALSAILCAIEKYRKIYNKLPNIELLFTVKEETGGGVEYFPFKLIKSKQGITFDYSQPFGKIVVSSPFIYNFKIAFIGKAAHASRPEEGKNSLIPAVKFILQVPQGKLDNGKTAINIGQVNSGNGINIIPEKTIVWGEVRSIDEKLFKKYLIMIKDKAEQVSKESGVLLDYQLDGYCPGYNYSETDPLIKKIKRIYESMNIIPSCDSSTGISDANPLVGAGIKTVNLSDGCENAHSTIERISVENLQKLENIVLKMIENFIK